MPPQLQESLLTTGTNRHLHLLGVAFPLQFLQLNFYTNNEEKSIFLVHQWQKKRRELGYVCDAVSWLVLAVVANSHNLGYAYFTTPVDILAADDDGEQR